ncbi:hypothetical protein [Fodinibius sp. Rm-B-1B1-1]|uniref:hypothetical protein n=1 Tax=Fodinibius alkaliphilus TaxID=3140241 RepID=UPI003159B9FF
MVRKKLHIALGIFVASLVGVTLTFSTLHSHHNLELHNSSEFANTGHCITADTTLCPICAHLIQNDDFLNDYSGPSFTVVNTITFDPANIWTPLFYLPNKGRSPPILG